MLLILRHSSYTYFKTQTNFKHSSTSTARHNMSSFLYPSLTPHSLHFRHKSTQSPPRSCNFQCNARRPTSPPDRDSQSDNAVLKLAWYGSELLGIAASFFRSPPEPRTQERELDVAWDDASGPIARDGVVETIKEDFQRSYFVTGNLTLNAYEENCEFADPAGSFKGLHRFKRNCSNFGSLLEKSDMKLMKWEDFEDRGVGHWRFSCVMVFPWKPILSATGYTEYYFDAQSGRICRHVEHWNVPKMALLKQIFTPSRKG